MNTTILSHLNHELNISNSGIRSTVDLLNSGATIPFIARYRKEATGELDEMQIKKISEKYAYFVELESRKETILNTVEEQGKLTADLRKSIQACREKTALEDIYAPYKPRRRTRAQMAREKGLEPLADLIWDQSRPTALEELAKQYLSDKIESIEDALKGAHDILAERIADNPEIRQWLRRFLYEHGIIGTTVRKEWKDRSSKYEMYYDFQEPVRSVAGHRFLAIRRAANEDVLVYKIITDHEPILQYINQRVITRDSPYPEFLEEVTEDSLVRLLYPSMSSSLLADVREKAEYEAIKVFAKNVKGLMMAPPAGERSVIAIDPGFRTGCKVVSLTDTGEFQSQTTIFPHPPQSGITPASKKVRSLIREHEPELVAVGNGTAGRETESFLKQVFRDHDIDLPVVMVNEAGASVYSASDSAISEFPDLDVTIRGAISIGRRLQDPLAELVKIEPKSIGVGQYQHDVNQTQLKEELDAVVSSCVNAVGVDVNTASKELLTYVSGLTSGTASAIISYRNDHGPFRERGNIQSVPGIGPVTYEQCAGFLKIRNGENPLDNSNVHPESYYIVEKMVTDVGKSLNEIIGRGIDVDPRRYVDDKKGLPTITDILGELKRPGRDPRAEFVTAKFSDAITEIEDVKVDMVLEGVVTNVTHFGAFIDIGVHQDGLVHISEIANRFVQDPNDELNVGQVVKVKVLSVDLERSRIGLSIKQL